MPDRQTDRQTDMKYRQTNLKDRRRTDTSELVTFFRNAFANAPLRELQFYAEVFIGHLT
jgi:hypothetical protein